MLKSLGVGIDLDVTKIAEAQIKKSLEQIIKLSEAQGRRQQDASRRSSAAIRDTAKHYTESMQTIHKTTVLLDESLASIGIRMEGINKQGLKTSLRTDADGNVQGGSIVTSHDAEKQKALLIEINALYRQQEVQIRAIWGLRDKLISAGGDREADTIRAQIREREALLATLREETAQKVAGQDTARQDASVHNLERELSYRNQIRQVSAAMREQVTEVNRLYAEEKKIVQEIASLQLKAMRGGNETDTIQKQIAAYEQMLASIREMRSAASAGMDTSRQDGALAMQQKSIQNMLAIKAATNQAEQEQRKLNKAQADSERISQQIVKTLTTMMTVYVTKAVKNFWKDAVDYAKQYYDQLNEIRIVSGLTETEANHLG